MKCLFIGSYSGALPFVWPKQTQAKNLTAACLMKYLLWGRDFHRLPPIVVGERFLEISVVDRRAMCFTKHLHAVALAEALGQLEGRSV